MALVEYREGMVLNDVEKEWFSKILDSMVLKDLEFQQSPPNL